ncbi:TIR domain-containing protein [Spirillospora sp. NPDC048911]|uniref:TIR domain-containing protein n=1 Tax=Spirillospora sp. NPDC048911 TaxID=3364527 RepID=UPI0037225ABC
MPWRAREQHQYDVFLSYNRAESQAMAEALQSGLQRLARPWWKARALRVFRDKSDLAAAPALWPTIENALAASQWLVLLASPGAARSPWVAKEVSWWLEHRPQADERLLIALTAGELRWGNGDFDRRTTDALPDALFGVYNEAPTWVDLRPENGLGTALPEGRLPDTVVADVAAPVHGRAKAVMVGEHLRQRRRTRRAVQATVAVLTVLALTATAAAIFAFEQRDIARDRARVAEARQLAALSGALTDERLDLAQPMAVAGYRLDRNTETRAALLRAVLASPHLVRYLDATDPVTTLAGARDGDTAVAGTRSGRVVRWNLARPSPGTTVMRLPTAIGALAVSAHGETIVAAGATTATLWAGGTQRPLSLPRGQVPQGVGLSPSGQRVAVVTGGRDDELGAPGTLHVLDRRTGRWTRAPSLRSGVRVAMPNETEIVLLDPSTGRWMRHISNALTSDGGTGPGFGVHGYAAALAQDGGYFTFSNGASELRVWRTDHSSADSDRPFRWVKVAAGAPTAVAVTSNGGRFAAADGAGTIHVTATTTRRGQDAPTTVLTGNSSVTTDTLLFLGPAGDRLLSATGRFLALWDLRQPSRLSTVRELAIPWSCNACPAPHLAVRPDGRQVAVLDGEGRALTLQNVPLSGVPLTIRSARWSYGPPLWNPRGDRLLVPTSDGGVDVLDGTAAVAHWAPDFDSGKPVDGDVVVLTGWSQAGHFVEIWGSGWVRMRDPSTGKVVISKRGPAGGLHAGRRMPEWAQFNARTGRAVLLVPTGELEDRRAVLIDTRDGGGTWLPGPAVRGVGFAGDRVIVQRTSGSLEIRSPDGRRLIRTFQSDNPGGDRLASDGGDLLVRLRPNGKALITDVTSGATLGILPLLDEPAIDPTGLAFSPDGRMLFAAIPEGPATGKGRLQQWSFDERAWSNVACTSAGHDISAGDWSQYVGAGVQHRAACG